MSSEIRSPLSGKTCSLVSTIASSVIIDLYRKDVGIDVSASFEKTDQIRIYECPDSGYRFYEPSGVLGDEYFYSLLEKKEDYYLRWKWENELAAKLIRSGDKLIDIGCGDGAFISQLPENLKTDATGIDTNSHAIAVANKSGKGKFHAATIGEWSKAHANEYDIATCFQILEHIPDPLPFLRQTLDCLKPNGLLIIAVPNNTPYLYHHDRLHPLNLPPHHAGLWNRKSLEYLATKLPMKKASVQTQPIGDQLNYYEYVQLEHFREKGNLLFSSLLKPVSNRIYGKWLRSRKDRIEGHSILITFRKSESI